MSTAGSGGAGVDSESLRKHANESAGRDGSVFNDQRQSGSLPAEENNDTIAGWNDPENIKATAPPDPAVDWLMVVHSVLIHSQTVMATGHGAPQQQWLTIHDPATCTRKGLCPVAKSRGQGPPLESHSLYFEQHGTGPVKVVFITGLNASLNAWAAEVKHFSRLPQYTILVFDHRGAGNSDTPMGPYSTSSMAGDVIALLDFIGWTESRSVHVVGLSLGGMIAQELAYRIPERFISLSLGMTTAGGLPIFNIPPWIGLKTILRLPFIKDPKKRTPLIVESCYNSSWLDAKAENDPEGRTNREVQIMHHNELAAVIRIQKPLGAISQTWAGLTHHVGAKRLAQISTTIPKVLILTGDQDHLVRPSNSAYLSKCMPEAEYVVWKETGHALNMQRVERFNTLLERVFLEGQARLDGS